MTPAGTCNDEFWVPVRNRKIASFIQRMNHLACEIIQIIMGGIQVRTLVLYETDWHNTCYGNDGITFTRS